MATPREQAISFIQTHVNKLLPRAKQGDYLKEQLEAMPNEEFDAYMRALESGDAIIPMTVPNLDNEKEEKLSVDRNLSLAKELGYDFFHHLKLTDPQTHRIYTTPEKYMVVLLPVRRQQQMAQKKITIPEGTKHVDEYSGQVTGPSKGAKISMPELQILYSQDLEDPLVELIKYRGGDIKGRQAMYRSIMDTGSASMTSLRMTNTSVKSTQTLGTILTAMMLKNTL